MLVYQQSMISIWEDRGVKYMKIIAFSGTCSTGKTSLAEELIKRHPDKIELCSEGTHEACETLGVKTPVDVLDQDRDKFQEMILDNHISSLKNKRDKEILITDRTIFDIFSYVLYYHNTVSDYLRSKLYNLCSLFAKTKVYTNVIYFPILENIDLDDGFRSGNKSKNKYKIFDYILKGIYSEFKLDCLTFPETSTLEDRIKIFEILYL